MITHKELPTKEELRNRITDQFKWRGETDTVVLIWRGYLAALLEWGLIDIDVYDEISGLLPPKGLKELNEVFLGEPISPEDEKEIDDLIG